MASANEITILLVDNITVGEEFTAKSMFDLIPDDRKSDITVSRIVAVIGYLSPEFFTLVSRGVYCITYQGLAKIKEHLKATAKSIYREHSYMENVFAGSLKANVEYSVSDIKDAIDDAGLKASLSSIRIALHKGMGIFIEKSMKHKSKYVISDAGMEVLKPIDFSDVSKSDFNFAIILDSMPKKGGVSIPELVELFSKKGVYFNDIDHVKKAMRLLNKNGSVRIVNGKHEKSSASIVDKIKLSDFDKLLFCN